MVASLKLRGLTNEEVAQRLQVFGPNQLPEQRSRPLLKFLAKFWGVIPGMLEATMLLQLALGKVIEATIILVMLLVNAIIGYAYEQKAQNALKLLRQQLRLEARTLRNDEWRLIPSSELVPGDVVRLRSGDIVPADAHLVAGEIAVDQSSLTGEAELIELTASQPVYAASLIRRGEAVVEIDATGAQTSFNKTANLVQTANSTKHSDVFIQRIVKYLMGFTVILVIGVLVNAMIVHLAFTDTLLFILALLIAAIPVSLPVTFTLGTAIGARELVQRGVLVTRLETIKEAAGMDVLCSDKTGTITKNELAVVATHTYNTFSKRKLLHLAALASDEATHDPIDIAILHAAGEAKPYYRKARRLEFTPFDPATKRTEALIRKKRKQKRSVHVVKGSPHVISELVPKTIDLTSDVERFAADGNRCIAIAAAKQGKPLKIAGLLALQDPPRDDAAAVVSRLHDLGVRVMMITGDGLPTARNIAEHVGITGEARTADDLRKDFASAAESFDVFARLYPEDKFTLVQTLQQAGHVVGMTGDGINDAPAIRQADVGVAVSNATDITKAAAGLVLTAPGLEGILAAVEVGRSIFQRITTYTLNKIIKTFHLGLFLTLGLMLTGRLITQPIHVLLLVLTNDLVSMSLTTDRVRPSATPDRQRIMPLIASGLVMALGWLAFSFAVYYVGRDVLLLGVERLQTLTFLMLVCVAQANVYLIRERQHWWCSRPSKWMLLATLLGLSLAVFFALRGVLMFPLGLDVIVPLFTAAFVFMCLLDFLKIHVFQLFALSEVKEVEPVPS